MRYDETKNSHRRSMISSYLAFRYIEKDGMKMSCRIYYAQYIHNANGGAGCGEGKVLES